MSEEVKITEDVVEAKANAVLEAARKVFMASIGAVVVAQENVTGLVGNTENTVNKFMEDVEAFINKLIERGEIAEKDGLQLFNDVIERRKSAAAELAENAQERLKEANIDTSRFDGLASRLNIPTKDDIEALTKKLSSLGKKVDNLKKVQEENATKSAETVTDVVEKASAKASENGAAVKKAAKKSTEAVAKATKKTASAAKKNGKATAKVAKEAVVEAAATVEDAAKEVAEAVAA